MQIDQIDKLRLSVVHYFFDFKIEFSGKTLAKREIVTDINFGDVNPDAVKSSAKNAVEDKESDDKQDAKEETVDAISEENKETTGKWFDPGSPLTPTAVDKLIEAVNKLNDVFGKLQR